MRRRIVRFAVVAAAVGLAACLAGPAAAQAGHPAVLTILHGLPEFTADVYVNGTLTLDGFEPESVTDPIELPAGTYDVAIRDVGAPATSTPALEGTLTLRAGQNYSAIAHLEGGGSPGLALFHNDLSPVAPGTARLVVRNTADAGNIHVRLDGDSVGGVVTQGHGRPLSVTPGRSRVAVMAADGTVLASTTVTLNEGTSTVLYLVGSSDGGTLDLMAQRFDDLATPPGDVLTGSGGLGADPSSPRWVPLAALMSVVIATALVLVRRSHRRTALPVAAAFATIVALSPAALGGSRAATDVGAVPAAGVAAAAAPVRVVDVGAARAAPSPAIAVHSGRLADLTSFGQRAAPTRVRIPALGVSGAIVPVGVEAGTNDVAIPTDVRTIGWYRFGARPGDAGSAVLVGHVASADQGAGLFYRLRDLAPGARIEVTFGDGSTRSFVVRARREYAKNDLPRDVFARSGASRLVLVTCGGPYDASTGHYRDNIVVYAVPVAGT